jgi:hypothetical protein
VSQLPWWVPEAIEEMAGRIGELEDVIVGAMDDNEEMYEALRFYAGGPNGGRARAIIER